MKNRWKNRWTAWVVAATALVVAGCGGGGGGGGGGSFVTHLYFSQDSNATGLFEIDPATGVATQVGAGNTGVTNSTCGLTETPSPFVLKGSEPFGIVNIAADGSGAHVIAGSETSEALGMNIVTGTTFSCLNGSFSTLHPATGASLGSLDSPAEDVEGLAADPEADLVYGIGAGSTNLLVYDPSTDTWNPVGDTGIAWNSAGLGFDHISGFLYAVEETTDTLYRINPNTGATVPIGALGEDGAGGLAFVVE
jgi:hypothetical protein